MKDEIETFLAASENWGTVPSATKQEKNEAEQTFRIELTEDLASEVLESTIAPIEAIWS